VILEDATFEAFGYEVWELSQKSNKPILAACELCGEFKVSTKHSYSTFCHSCGVALGDTRKGKKNCNFGKRGKETNGFKGGPVKCICLCCGKKFYVNRYKRNHGGGKFCSNKCKNEVLRGKEHHFFGVCGEKCHNFKGGLIKCVCQQCGIIFFAPSSGIKRGQHKYCSRECYGKAHKGKKNGRWKGGISFEPYCIKFNASFKHNNRDQFNNVCFLCGKTEKKNGRALDVHHVNYNKNCGCDNTTCICVPLCHSCHSKTNGNRKYWEKKIMNKLKETMWGWM